MTSTIPHPTGATATAPPAETATEIAPPAVAVEELEGFEPRTIVHANVEFTVTGVRAANQTPQSYAAAGEPEASEQRFVFLDVTALNLMTRSRTEFRETDFSLLVGGDVVAPHPSMSFLSDLVSILLADSAVDSFLAFPIADSVAVEDIALQIGTAPDRVSVLPLTGAIPDAVYPISETLDGTATAEGIGPTNAGTLVFTALDVTYAIDRPLEDSTSPTGDRADADEVFVTVHVRAEKTSGRGNESLTDAFRLLVDDVPLAPWDVATDPTGSIEGLDVEPGSSVEGWVGFIVPADVTSLVLQVGDFEEEPGTIDLPVPALP